MRCTLKMIAERAGVSIMAVSAALNKTTRTRISEEKRRYIQELANEMGYVPNLVAQSLSGGKTRMIGVVIDSCAQETCYQVLRGIEEESRRQGYRVIVAEQHDSVPDIVESCRSLQSYGVDGIIALAHCYPGQQPSPDLCQDVRNIVFWEPYQDPGALYVGTSADAAFREVLSGWKRIGRRNPALVINDAGIVPLTSRVEAFTRISRELGYSGEVIYADLMPNDERTLAVMETVFTGRIKPGMIDAVLTESDLWALGLMKVASRHGYSVPADLAVVGWDDNSYCEMMTPALARISLGAVRQGEMLFRLLLGKAEKQDVVSIELPAVFRNRESSGF